MGDFVYKLCSRLEWEQAKTAGIYTGSPDDLRDGFIHLSNADQVETTAAKYFSKEKDLVLIRIRAKHLEPDLKYEPSRGGRLFPHLYASLDPAITESVVSIPFTDGRHHFEGKL